MGCCYSTPAIDKAPDEKSRLKEQISRDPELLSIVKDYRKNSKKTSRFLSKLKIGLRKARGSGLLIVKALQRLEYGDHPATVLERLNSEFMGRDILFTNSFLEELKETFEREKSLLLKLQNRKQKLAVKFRRFKIWRKVYDVVFNAASLVVFLCSILFASMGAAAEQTTFTVAASGVMTNIKRSIDSSVWDRYQRKYDEKMRLISDIEMILITMDELDKIMELAKQFKTQVDELLTSSVESAELIMEGISISLKNIKVKAKAFVKDLNSLEEAVDNTMAKFKNAMETLLHILPADQVDAEAVDAASNEDEQTEEEDEPDIDDLLVMFQSAPPNNQGSSQAYVEAAVDATGTHVEHVEAADEPRDLTFVIRTFPGGQEHSQEIVVMRGTAAQARREPLENSFDTDSDQGCDMDYDE
ncbi:hypothetical protein J5N97_015302 [Dioscorea zingiberensis]|uniref:Uncharacterized protein n=1 Tax=Dioscorea zingiberensis TaxID=325984 RepID=A0A9D5CV39_9LILI|nr:hypothetical protein J5N97_015302 [Dioscorea zingiberensis]